MCFCNCAPLTFFLTLPQDSDAHKIKRSLQSHLHWQDHCIASHFKHRLPPKRKMTVTIASTKNPGTFACVLFSLTPLVVDDLVSRDAKEKDSIVKSTSWEPSTIALFPKLVYITVSLSILSSIRNRKDSCGKQVDHGQEVGISRVTNCRKQQSGGSALGAQGAQQNLDGCPQGCQGTSRWKGQAQLWTRLVCEKSL